MKIHPAVIEAAGMELNNPVRRAWNSDRYNEELHPIPVLFAERFDYWDSLSEEDRARQIQLEEDDPRGGRFTMIGAKMGDGILGCRSRFAKACAAAVTVGDRIFFQVFHEVYTGLGNNEFPPIPFRAAAIGAWRFLTEFPTTQEWDDDSRQWIEKRVIAGEFPTIAEIHSYLKLQKNYLPEWNVDPEGAITRVLKKHRLQFGPGTRGGDRRSKRCNQS